MPDSIRIFLGSAGETRRITDEIAAYLRKEDGVEVLAWTDPSAFPPGRTYIESLEANIRKSNCALLVATALDETKTRGQTQLQPRDNIVLEYGMALTAFGRDRSALAVIGTPHLPSDVQNVNHVFLPDVAPDATDLAAFRSQITIPLREWVEHLRKVPKEPTLQTDLPNLYRRIAAILKRLGDENPQRRLQIDLAASDVIESVAQSFSDDFGFDNIVAFMEQEQLRECDGIFAVDALGPSAWVSPKAYRYLASQTRHYLRRNSLGSEWKLVLSNQLKDSIDRSIRAALDVEQGSQRVLSQSLTMFDNPKELPIEVGQPHLEYARLLLWSKQELLSPVADAVITIHDQFSVPLFFVETAPEDSSRDLDFIAIRHRTGHVTGRINSRKSHGRPYTLSELERGIVPGRGAALDFYWKLLGQGGLMLAKDARFVLRYV